jgi:hypothetical protein
MDDGTEVKKGGTTLCTDNFTLEEVEVLIKILENKFNFKCTTQRKKSKNKARFYYRIYISKKSLPLLQSLILEFMHPSMVYKITLDVPLKSEVPLSQTKKAIRQREERRRIREWKKVHGKDSMPPKKERTYSTNPKTVKERLRRQAAKAAKEASSSASDASAKNTKKNNI